MKKFKINPKIDFKGAGMEFEFTWDFYEQVLQEMNSGATDQELTKYICEEYLEV